MDFQDYYKTLSIAASADSETIKIAYRKLARQYHPDVSGHHKTEEKFKQIAEAYEVLKDPRKRAQYDQLLEQQQAQGGQGLDDVVPGNLYQRIDLESHSLFEIEAHNLIIIVLLAPWEAALGTSLELPTLSGKVKLRIPPNSETGQRLRIKGSGLVHKDGQGDLYAVLKVVLPDSGSDEIKQYWQQQSGSTVCGSQMEWRG